MKLFKSLVFGNSSFFHFSEIMKFLFEFIFIRTHKTPWLLGQGGNLLPLRSRGLRCSVTTESTWIAFRFVYVAPFLVVLRDFARNWGLPIAKKSGTASCLTNSSKLQYQIGRATSRFVGLKTPCLQCLVGFSNRPYRKVIKFEKNSNLWAVLGDPNFDTKHAIYATNVTVSESSVSE